MGLAAHELDSDLLLRLRKSDGTADPEKWPEYKDIRRTPRLRAVPASLWGVASDVRPADPNAPALVAEALAGFDVGADDLPPDTTDQVSLAALQYDGDHQPLPLPFLAVPAIAGNAAAPPADAAGAGAGESTSFVLRAIADAADVRAGLIADMRRRGMLTVEFDDKAAVALGSFATTTILDASPTISVLGEI
jgi:hypothetical protein